MILTNRFLLPLHQFFKNMKPVFLLTFISLIVLSCSPYQKALKSEDMSLKYHMADSLYNVGKFKKALKLMEQLVPSYRGKPQGEKLMYLYSDTFYQLGDHYLAGYQFDRFTSSYPNSEKAEEAAFKAAKSYYELSPRFSLDQKETYTALDKLQAFVTKYPDSEYLSDANKLVQELTEKLEEKSFKIAKQYYTISDYKAAIAALDNFLLDYPGSKYRQEAYYLRFLAAYDLAIRSIPSLVDERLDTAKQYYGMFKRYYPESEMHQDAEKILQDIDKRLQNKEV